MKLSKVFINMMRNKTVNVSISDDREVMECEGDYMSVSFSVNDEYKYLDIGISRYDKNIKEENFDDYTKEVVFINEIIEYAKVIYEVEGKSTL